MVSKHRLKVDSGRGGGVGEKAHTIPCSEEDHHAVLLAPGLILLTALVHEIPTSDNLCSIVF